MCQYQWALFVACWVSMFCTSYPCGGIRRWDPLWQLGWSRTGRGELPHGFLWFPWSYLSKRGDPYWRSLGHEIRSTFVNFAGKSWDLLMLKYPWWSTIAPRWTGPQPKAPVKKVVIKPLPTYLIYKYLCLVIWSMRCNGSRSVLKVSYHLLQTFFFVGFHLKLILGPPPCFVHLPICRLFRPTAFQMPGWQPDLSWLRLSTLGWTSCARYHWPGATPIQRPRVRAPRGRPGGRRHGAGVAAVLRGRGPVAPGRQTEGHGGGGGGCGGWLPRRSRRSRRSWEPWRGTHHPPGAAQVGHTFWAFSISFHLSSLKCVQSQRGWFWACGGFAHGTPTLLGNKGRHSHFSRS